METELGKIQGLVKEAKDNESKSPLKEKLDEFGETLTKVIGIICIIVWVINYKNFFDDVHGSWVKGCIYYFKISISLAVAAIPEGLPAVITTCLALGTKRMTEHNALIRKLDSIETLGCTTVICSDKTGTLTTNNMTVTRILYFKNESNKEIRNLTGVSYEPFGDIENFEINQFESIRLLTECASLNNGATVEYDSINKSYKIHGTPTEAALRIFVEKAGNKDSRFQKEKKDVPNPMEYNNFILNNFKVLFTLEFDRERKCKSVLVQNKKTNEVSLLVKGASELMVQKCDQILYGDSITKLTEKRRDDIMSTVNTNFAKHALRTLAIGFKKSLPKELTDPKNYNSNEFLKKYFSDYSNVKSVENNIVLIGVVGIIDPPRVEVKEAIATCYGAGIRVIMITGDNKVTAEAIGMEIGLVSGDDLSHCSFQTSDFFKLPEATQIEYLRSSPSLIFSRSDPKHKMTLVTLLKKLVSLNKLTNRNTLLQ
jgi:Ca2+-transporting ATPase